MGALRPTALLVLVVTIVTGVWVSARPAADGATDGALTAALAVAPADLQSIDVTDWSALREQLAGGQRGDELDDAERQQLVSDAAAADLSTRSVLVDGTTVIGDLLGWSPATVAWEAYVQAASEGALLVGLPTGIAETEERLEAGGWVREDDSDLWTIEPSVLRQEGIGSAGLGSAELYRNVRLLPSRGVAIVSSSAEHAARLAAVSEGEVRGAAADPGLVQLARELDGLDTVLLQSGAIGCASTDPAQGSGDVVAQAAAAVQGAGELREYRWLARGIDASTAGGGDSASGGGRAGGEDDVFRLALALDGGALAADQAGVRAALATGPFIGQSGTVEDTIELIDARADGSVAVLDFTLQPRAVALMAARGPFLPAAC